MFRRVLSSVVFVALFASIASFVGPQFAGAAVAPGGVRNVKVVVTAIDRATGDTSMSVSFDQAANGGPTDHYQVDACQIPGGDLTCPGWTSLPDVAAGPSHIVVPGSLTCPSGISTCFFRVRGVDATNTLFGPYKQAGITPWAPFGVSAASGPDPGDVTVTFSGPSESGAPVNREYVLYVCTAGCGLDANWSDSGLSIPYPAAGSVVYPCGINVNCSFRMQFDDGSGATSSLSDLVSATGPVLTIDQPLAGAATNDPTISGTCTIGLGTVTATVNPGANLFTSACSPTGTWSVSIVSLPDAIYSVTASQAGSPLAPAGPVSFTYDTTAPVTTDNTGSIGGGWHTSPVTVILSPTDNLSGVAATYYTTNGSTPTLASPTGTSIPLSDGVYTIKYFSVDVAGNVENVKTAGTVMMVDSVGPVIMFTPANGARVGFTRWSSECSFVRAICGTVTDATSGVASFGPATVTRSSDGRYWNGSAWKPTASNAPISGPAGAWSIPISANLQNNVSYTVTMQATDVAGNNSTVSATFLYDITKPSPLSLVTTDNNGTIGVGDSMAVTFSEAIDPASATGASTLTMTRTASTPTKYSISGLTDTTYNTMSTGYVTAGAGTRTVTYDGTLSVSGTVVTFTVTTGCVTGCAFATTGAPAGKFRYGAAGTIADIAGNFALTGIFDTGPVVMF